MRKRVDLGTHQQSLCSTCIDPDSLRLLPTCLAGVNFVLHVAGWLEGGLAMGYEKFVMDTDFCGALHAYLKGVNFDDNALAMDAFQEVGPGSHFLGSPLSIGTLPAGKTVTVKYQVTILNSPAVKPAMVWRP